MNDEASVATNGSSRSNDRTVSTVSSISSRGLGCERVINVMEDFEGWKIDKNTKYLLPNLLCRSRVEEKMTVDKNASDAVVWNILYLTSDKMFPITSPTIEQRVQALAWLNTFKKYMNKVMTAEVRSRYCNIANMEKWSTMKGADGNFNTFEDLVKRTKYATGKEVNTMYVW